MENNKPKDCLKLYTPHPLQKQIHDACSLKDPCFYVCVIAGRQSGKSMAAINQVIDWAFNYPGSIIWYICHKDALISKVYRDIVKILNQTPYIKRKSKSKGGAQIELSNGTIIEFKSARAEDSLRGNTVNFMVIDEAAFISKNTIEGDIMGTLMSGGRKCLICSTPKGKNWLFEFYMDGLSEDNKTKKSFKFNSYDTLGVKTNKEQELKNLEIFKNSMSPELFSQEFLAEFVDSGAVFRNIEKVCILPPGIKSKTVYMACDIGFVNDYTVLSIIDDGGNVIEYDRFRQLEFNQVIQRIKDYITKWKPYKIIIEENNQGLPVIRALEHDGITNIEAFKTTGESKGPLINQLIAAFSGMEIRIINDEEVKKELMAFIFDITASGKIRYKAGFGHDDIVISIALGWHCYVNNQSSGTYNIYTKDTMQKELDKTKEKGMGNEIIIGGEDEREIDY